jgi:hypothetical protein
MEAEPKGGDLCRRACRPRRPTAREWGRQARPGSGNSTPSPPLDCLMAARILAHPSGPKATRRTAYNVVALAGNRFLVCQVLREHLLLQNVPGWVGP